jgi:hypothetical protein
LKFVNDTVTASTDDGGSRDSTIAFNITQDIRFYFRQVYLQHKAVVLILVWTMIVGELLAFEQLLIGEFIDS